MKVINILFFFQYAEDNAIPFVLLIGESEIVEGVMKIRTTSTREEETVPRDQVASKLIEKLKNLENDSS